VRIGPDLRQVAVARLTISPGEAHLNIPRYAVPPVIGWRWARHESLTSGKFLGKHGAMVRGRGRGADSLRTARSSACRPRCDGVGNRIPGLTS